MQSKAQEFRLQCRRGDFNSHTSGSCAGFAQANLIILPNVLAKDFEDLCFRNPVPCPLLSKIPKPTVVEDKRIINGEDFDIRTDLPKYNIYKDGKFVGEKSDVTQEWTEDHVGFLIGCSFSFENELSAQGFTPKHQKEGKNVSMYITTKYLNAAGVFVKCPYVVSMRPYKVDDLENVRDISRQFRKTHGEPIDWGYEAVKRLGISDIKKPEFGDAIEIADNEIPVFWACGVTPQAAIRALGDKAKGIVMGHSPGHMLILDLTDSKAKNL
ncbi:hypothetical protein PSN45_000394 [Yamadazyma tenuis]|uniref:DUF1445-domain-containing protein n=1 Tax=Candida tenuis (strain ATCC 10573 / BCRC 21748 / CBS 615 / JCM 9827 / NBRC 10315 / NRRL Y-1498 / VKM Y-70) TaxID=590646 RepID=G3B873_CANTC|nr:DUF1445-domain-containing protein [Yamadazyma tenuis ATCC 10573]EGV61705.1 DUF1445-domain-containing protein [Yamadazyma tenuis ATCC 10573]WEJ92936.1 hypothetical protein PSN45_000394 [Yamadazyma tenuis]